MKKIFVTSLLILFLVGVVSAQEAYNCPMGGYGGMMYGSYGYGAMSLGWIISILLVALIIAAIYWLIKSANRKR